MNNKNNNSSGGLGVLSVLQIIFIVLKLVNVISWSWCAVFIPTFIGLGVCAITIAVVFVLAIIQTKRK